MEKQGSGIATLVTIAAAGLAILPLGGCPTLNQSAGGPTAGLIGVWRASFVDPTFGPGQVELILMSNGRFQQQTAYQAGALVTIYGTFRVFPEQPLLRLDIERGEPTQTCGPLGCTPVLYPAGESYGYTLTADGRLVLQNLNCVEGSGAVCVFQFVRIA